MIQATGTIKANDGITAYVDPLINVYFASTQKHQPAIGVAQVGKIVGEEDKSFNAIAQIGTYIYTEPNPSFEAVQLVVLEGLKTDYPTVTFEIV